VPCAVK